MLEAFVGRCELMGICSGVGCEFAVPDEVAAGMAAGFGGVTTRCERSKMIVSHYTRSMVFCKRTNDVSGSTEQGTRSEGCNNL